VGEAVPGQVDQVGGDLFQLGLARVEPPLPGERDHAHQHLGVQRRELGIVAAGGEEVGQDVLDLAGDVAEQRAVGARARTGIGVPDQDAEAVGAFIDIGKQRQRDPLMPFSIFRLRTLRGANIVGLLIGMSLFSMFFFISLYLQDVLHYSPIKTGISYLPLAVGIIVSAGVASQLVTRLGFKLPLIAGMLLIAGGLVMAALVAVTAVIDLASGRQRPAWLCALGYMFAVLLSLLNVFVHSRDGYTAVVPTGLTLSAVVVAILFLVATSATWTLTSRRRGARA